MSEYLSKEEIKHWRSSLEKITLEEYAARLGKVIAEEKHTNDLVDIVLKGQPVISKADSLMQTRGEKISSIAQRTFDREKEISSSPFSVSIKEHKSFENKPVKEEKRIVKTEKVDAPVKKQKGATLRDDVNLTFSKALTDREQVVFEYFLNNKNNIVYAKDLAKLLDLPRDYVYKYIKNLRSKIEGDKLENADNGGYVLNI